MADVGQRLAGLRVGAGQQFDEHRQTACVQMDLLDQGFIGDLTMVQVLAGFLSREWLQGDVRNHASQFRPVLLQRIAAADDEEDRGGKIAILTVEQVEQPGGECPRRALEDVKHDNQALLFGGFVQQVDKKRGQGLFRLTNQLYLVLVAPPGDRITRQLHHGVACGFLVDVIGKDPNARRTTKALDGEVSNAPSDHVDHTSRRRRVALDLLARLQVLLVSFVELPAGDPPSRQLFGDSAHDFHREQVAICALNDIGGDLRRRRQLGVALQQRALADASLAGNRQHHPLGSLAAEVLLKDSQWLFAANKALLQALFLDLAPGLRTFGHR